MCFIIIIGGVIINELLYEYKEIVFTFLAPDVKRKMHISESSARSPITNQTPLRFAQLHSTLRLRECIRKHNGQYLNECHSQNATSINSTLPEIRARASGSRPARRNLSPDLRILARAGRAAISIPTHVFYENHGIPENRVGYIHSKWKDFRDFQKFHFSGNPSPSLRIWPHASESEPRPQNLGSGRADGAELTVPSRP